MNYLLVVQVFVRTPGKRLYSVSAPSLPASTLGGSDVYGVAQQPEGHAPRGPVAGGAMAAMHMKSFQEGS